MSEEKPLWKRSGRSLVPANDRADELLRGVRPGELITFRWKTKRSLPQMRLYFGLMNLLVKQQVFPSKDAASLATKVACGHVDIAIMPDTGEVVYMPRHINFDALPQAEFNTFFENAVNVVVERFLPGNTPEEVMAELERMLTPIEIQALLNDPGRDR